MISPFKRYVLFSFKPFLIKLFLFNAFCFILSFRSLQINTAAAVIYEAVDPNANIIFGSLVDESMEGEIAITVIATGFEMGASDDKSGTSVSSGNSGHRMTERSRPTQHAQQDVVSSKGTTRVSSLQPPVVSEHNHVKRGDVSFEIIESILYSLTTKLL